MNIKKYEKGAEFRHTAGTRHRVCNNSWIIDLHSKDSGVVADVCEKVILIDCRVPCLTERKVIFEYQFTLLEAFVQFGFDNYLYINILRYEFGNGIRIFSLYKKDQ